MKIKQLEHAPARSVRELRVRVLVDFAANQSAWWCSVLVARAGGRLLAVLGPLAYIAARAGRIGEVARVASLAAAGALIGALGDTTLVRAGCLSFPPALRVGPTAPFMLSLWAMFAVSLSASAAFVRELHPLWSALLGAAAGPLAYGAGVRLGVLSVEPGSLLAIALEWALAVPLLAAVARAVDRRVAA
jgi:hypothetical protein